jgi:hypothetical protein
MMTRGTIGLLAAVACTAAASGSIFNTNGFAGQYRLFNGMPTSNLTVNGVAGPGVDGMGDPLNFDNIPVNGLGTIPVAGALTQVTIRDEFPFPTGNQGFANKTQAMFSADGGLTPLGILRSESFDLRFTVRLTSGNPLLRKEGGLVFYNPRGLNPATPDFIDEGRLLVASNSFTSAGNIPLGETAIFGASMPFTGGGAGGFPGGQTGFANGMVANGVTYDVRFIYHAPGSRGLGTGAAYEAFFDGQSSTLREWGNEFDGQGFNDGTRIGFMGQFQYFPGANDLGEAQYQIVSLIPTPGAAGMLGLGGLVALRRRR